MKSEKKLWGQSGNVSCHDNGSWFIDTDYTLPDTGTDAPAGYQAGWVYNDKVLEKTTVLKPADKSTDTSDNSHIALYGVALIAAIAIGFFTFKKTKKN